MRHRLSIYLPYLSLALTLTGAITGCKRNTAEAADTKTQQLVIGTENIAIARQGSVTNGPAISGSLVPELDASVRAQVSGSVLSTSADIGQSVTKGQTLARIDAGGLQDAYLSARAAVASAQSTYDIAARDLQRNQTLLGAGAIAQRDLETAQRTASSASAALEDAKSRLALAQKNFENTRITAPFNGVVSQKSVGPGDVVQPGSAMFTIVEPSSMRLEASVPSDQLSMVRLGTDVAFTVTGYPDREFHGKVTRVSPSVDPATRQVQIIVSIPNIGNTLVGGLYADGRISSATRHGIVVPTAAIDTRMQRPAVLKVHDGKVERIDVTLGMRDPNAETVEIASGVNPGDTLLVAAAQGITPGTPVRVEASPSDRGVAGQGGPSASGSNSINGTSGGTSGATNTPSGVNNGNGPTRGTSSSSNSSGH